VAPIAKTIAPLLPRPAKMQVEELGRAWSVSWRWFSPQYIFLAFFCCVWDGFLMVWYATALHTHLGTGVSLIAILFPVLHVAVGVWLTYTTLCGFFNTTCVSLDAQELSISHGPLPWAGLRMQRSVFRQLYCKQVVSNNSKDSTSTTYNLMAVLNNGEERKLLGSLNDVAEARFLEQQLERRLGIVDQEVVGEVA
jgi:hypothetical protein